MTQDEVDLIYDYLHENYRYKDGIFIGEDHYKNKKLNGFCAQSGRMRATLHINKKDYYVRYSALIWIFHNKEFFYFYDYKDGNSVNNKIENLIPLNTIEHSYAKRNKSKGYREILRKNGDVKYAAEVFMNKKSHNFGLYNTKEEAITAYQEAKKLWVFDKINPIEIKKILIDKNIMPIKKIIIPKIPRNKKGYSLDKRDNKYYAYHYVSKKRIGLGSFDNPEEAHEAYLKAKEEMKYVIK